MFGLALEVTRRRWLLSVSIVLMMILTLMNTTATLGLLSYVSTTYNRLVESAMVKDSYYVPDLDLTEAGIKAVNSQAEVYGFTHYWQAYGMERPLFKQTEEDFVFMPIKVITHAPSWRLPLKQGRLPQLPNQMLINQYMAKAFGLGLGDTLTLGGYNHRITYQVCGIIADRQYESRQSAQQRVFVGQVPKEIATGIAFDLSDAANFNQTYYETHQKPLVAEYIPAGAFRDLHTRPLVMPLLISFFMWLLQLLLIVFLMTQVMHLLVLNYPHSLVFKGRMRFDHLDVYLNYFMLLLGIAFGISLILLRPYLMNLTVDLPMDFSKINPLQLLVIHGIGLGFWMNTMVAINAYLQRMFVKRRTTQALHVIHYEAKRRPIRLTRALVGVAFVNGILALLLLIAFEGNHWSESLLQYPSLWGFADTPVTVNTDGDRQLLGYTYQPVVIEGPDLIYAKGVVSEAGFEPFGIQLINGRLPKWPNEIVVGRGLVKDTWDLGEHIRFYDARGNLNEGVVVGIAHALFDDGRIMGYMAPSEKTFRFSANVSGYKVDYATFVRRHFNYILESVQGFIIPLVSSMILMGFGILVVFYASTERILRPVRRQLIVMRVKWLSGFILISLFSASISAVGFFMAKVFWYLMIVPSINWITSYLGIEISTLSGAAPDRWLGLLLLYLVNTAMLVVFMSYEGNLWYNGSGRAGSHG